MDEILAITGITGKSGQAFAYRLEQNQEKIRKMFPGGIRLLLHKERERDKDILPSFDVQCMYGDLEDELFLGEAFLGVDTIVHIAGIHWSRQIVHAAANNFVRRMICVHTTGIYSKYKEAGEEYRNIDDFVYMMSKSKNIILTILRPTMIYGTINDHNVASFIRMVDKLPFMPVVNNAEYELQPVHFADLGKAYYDVLVSEKITGGHDYILSGGEEITLRDMLIEMGAYLSKRMRFVSVPFPIAYAGAWFFYLVSIGKIDLREKVQRRCEPRVYPHAAATRDFGYDPRTFRSAIGDEVREYLRATGRLKEENV
jgi:nucleoside-diphosphate-sugar epimerase